MAEIRVQVRQARQVQITEVQLQAERFAIIGELLRCFLPPAAQDAVPGLVAVTQRPCVIGTLANTHIALALTTA